MANWSDAYINIRASNVLEFAAMKETLDNSIINNYMETTSGSMEISDIIYCKYNFLVEIDGKGRWGAPVYFFEDLCIKYKLSGEIMDTEPGSNFFILKEFINGILEVDIDSEYLSKESISHRGMDLFEYEYYSVFDETMDDIFEDYIDNAKIFIELGYYPDDFDIDEFTKRLNQE